MNRRKVGAWVGGAVLAIALACSGGGQGGNGTSNDDWLNDCYDNGGEVKYRSSAVSDIEECVLHGKVISKRVKPKNAPGNQWQ